MASPEELLQQVRDGTLSAQEFTNQFFSLGADVATYGHLINEAYSIELKRLTIEKEKEIRDLLGDNTMSSPEELLQQVRDGTLSAQEFADHISALVDQGEKLWTYSDLVGEAFAIEFAIKKDEEKKSSSQELKKIAKITSRIAEGYRNPRREKYKQAWIKLNEEEEYLRLNPPIATRTRAKASGSNKKKRKAK